MSRIRIHRVNQKRLLNVIDSRIPLGLFLTKEGHTWVAVDNSTGDAWTEDFATKRECLKWLKNRDEGERV